MTGSDHIKQRRRVRRTGVPRIELGVSGYLLIGFLAVAIAIGGGGVPAVRLEGLTILFAIGVLGFLAVKPSVLDRRMPLGAWLLAAALPLLILLHLVPLPVSLWTSLPLRAPLVTALQALGEPLPAWPLSIDPASTWWSLLSLLPPFAAFILAYTLDRNKVPAVLLAIAGLAAASGLLEAAQAIIGDAFFLHSRSIDAGPSGFFANQNSQATFLVIGIVAIVTLVWLDPRSRKYLPVLVTGGLFLVLCVLMTRSRAGAGLLLVPLVMIAVMAFVKSADRRKWALGSLVTLAALPVVIFGALQIEQIRKLADRFGDLSSGRAQDIWPDAWYLAQEAWPWGMGIGTFRQSFELVERLEVVDTTTANRAHLDWLEFVIEAGLPAVILLIVGLGAIVWSIWRKRKRLGPAEVFSMGALLIIALHSSVDYPLRAISLAVMAAAAMAWILSDGTHFEKPN